MVDRHGDVNAKVNAPAATTVDEADRLMGLWLAGAGESDLRKASQVVLGRQREDGGWAQTPHLDSDAFGTAAALYSLRTTGFLKISEPAYRRGAQYLLNTQFPDGSWYVRSRVVKLQPYFQSAFPFDHEKSRREPHLPAPDSTLCGYRAAVAASSAR